MSPNTGRGGVAAPRERPTAHLPVSLLQPAEEGWRGAVSPGGSPEARLSGGAPLFTSAKATEKRSDLQSFINHKYFSWEG